MMFTLPARQLQDHILTSSSTGLFIFAIWNSWIGTSVLIEGWFE